ncbi:MAG: ABC transporter ATP-binding protein [Vallitaleaceae bacterium]|nr:ABC transporter ATP-binding protein [Vallitaleaceae bacterium]
MIEVKNISKQYGRKQALTNINLRIKQGEVVGFLGLNGAGKSTAMNILTGYISADSGYVTIGGYDIAKEPLAAKKLIGYLPEQFFFYNDMKVVEYLSFICDIKKIKKGRKEHIDDLCDRVGISHIKSRMIKNLYKGYRQRVGLVQALLGNPEVVILDEPTVGLDPSQVVDIRSLIKEVGEKRTVIISSHILSEVQLVCSRVVLIHDGKIIADDTPDNLRKSMHEPSKVIANIEGEIEAVKKALGDEDIFEKVIVLKQKEIGAYEYLIEGKKDSDIRRRLFECLAKANLPALSIKSSEFTLEDFFLKHIENSDGTDKEVDDVVHS